jgi:hypothetical protein
MKPCSLYSRPIFSPCNTAFLHWHFKVNGHSSFHPLNYLHLYFASIAHFDKKINHFLALNTFRKICWFNSFPIIPMLAHRDDSPIPWVTHHLLRSLFSFAVSSNSINTLLHSHLRSLPYLHVHINSILHMLSCFIIVLVLSCLVAPIN